MLLLTRALRRTLAAVARVPAGQGHEEERDMSGVPPRPPRTIDERPNRRPSSGRIPRAVVYEDGAIYHDTEGAPRCDPR